MKTIDPFAATVTKRLVVGGYRISKRQSAVALTDRPNASMQNCADQKPPEQTCQILG
jgi:hypothetical protein